MPEIDLSLIGSSKGPVITDYTWKDAALYALAVGAGPDDLPLIYERNPGGMKVLPGFVVVPAIQAWPSLGDIRWPLMIHAEQMIRLHRPVPPEGRLVQTGRVDNIYDKGKGALLEITICGELVDKSPVYEAKWNLFYLGAGGFGGERGPAAPLLEAPDAAPDYEVTYQIPDTQAALFRLLGDLNPLHIDPAASAMAGFDRPILHGLCTYGYASRAVVDGLLGGDPGGLKEFSTRFTGPVYPGERLTIKVWRQGSLCFLEAETSNGPVLKNGRAVVE